MPRPNHFFSSNLHESGVRHDVFFWHGAELESPWPAVDPAQAARLGGGNTISKGAAALPPAWDTTSGVASRATSGSSETTSMASGSSWWTSA